MHRLKYFFAYLIPASILISFNVEGIYAFAPLFIFFGLVPLLELFIKPDAANWDKKRLTDEKNQRIYDWILYLALPMQLIFLIYFLFTIDNTAFNSGEFYGRITAMGLMCGVLGINVGHELGHRHNRWEQLIGEILLLTSLDTHFLPYHNGGHHRNVATPKDSATARKNEILFSFWIRSHFGSYLEAWKIENQKLKVEDKTIISIHNRMIVYSIANVFLLSIILFAFNWQVLVGFLLAATTGIILLESVNYIEHYGLLRKQKSNGRYEPVRHQHSWNSDHVIGRALLFNLSRHSDHHYNGSKKYQILESLEHSPQMPTGYPGMMVLAVIQPIWFWLMNKKLEALESELSK